MNDNKLKSLAKETRKGTIKAIYQAKSGHPGGSLSYIDIMVFLYAEQMNPKPYNPDDPHRDIFVLSKGHASPALYALWDCLGYSKIAQDLRKLGSAAQGHPSLVFTSYCETSTGSLGQGFAVAVGMALALKGSGRKVYVIIGDGEMHEGIVAEAARMAAFYGLNNLVCILDYNSLQSDKHSAMMVNPPAEFTSWGWQVRIVDGHDFNSLQFGFESNNNHAPVCIVAQTFKGKGVKSWEDKPEYHGSVTLSDEQLKQALESIG